MFSHYIVCYRYYAAPTEENVPNIYNEMLSINDGTLSQNQHQYDDVDISQEETKSDSLDYSSNESQQYMHVD